jgi:hypothetical protein
MERQPVYSKIHNEFVNFIESNRHILKGMKVNEVVDLRTREEVYAKGLLGPPIEVAFVALAPGAEGNYIVFMDRKFEKLFSYYDVK